MFRSIYKSAVRTDDMVGVIALHNGGMRDGPPEDAVLVVCAASPMYSEYAESLIDDFITVRFNVIQRVRRRLSDDEVADWFRIRDCNEDDTETAAQYANGVSDIFLLSRVNAIPVGERLAELHNAPSLAKCGKCAIYISPNMVEAYRDIRILFPKFAATTLRQRFGGDALDEVRAYAQRRVMDPLATELATIELARSDERRRERRRRALSSPFH